MGMHDMVDELDERIRPDEYRIPRVVVVSECFDGQFSWAELTDNGHTEDTTLTGVVLDPIGREIRSGAVAGTVTVDGIVYAFVFGRYRKSC
jgi:hypothetical protein